MPTLQSSHSVSRGRVGRCACGGERLPPQPQLSVRHCIIAFPIVLVVGVLLGNKADADQDITAHRQRHPKILVERAEQGGKVMLEGKCSPDMAMVRPLGVSGHIWVHQQRGHATLLRLIVRICWVT